jgi:hypothetical protein
MADEDLRCDGCGKVVDTGSDVARVAMGTYTVTNGFREKKQWGILHRSCFNRAIGSPDAVLEEIRAIRRSGKKSM